jgi:hypothetical protein
MLRSQKIPAKLVKGFVSVSSESIYHAWNEVYTKETGWITINSNVFFGGGEWGRMDSTLAAGNTDGKLTEFINNDNNYIRDKIF